MGSSSVTYMSGLDKCEVARRKGFEPLTSRFEVFTMLLMLLTSVQNAAHAAFTIRCFPPPAVIGDRYGTSELNRDGMKNFGTMRLTRPPMPVHAEAATYGRAELRRTWQ